MVAINFMSQFAPMIESGTKIHTLRDKARCKVGDTLQLYTGQCANKGPQWSGYLIAWGHAPYLEDV